MRWRGFVVVLCFVILCCGVSLFVFCSFLCCSLVGRCCCCGCFVVGAVCNDGSPAGFYLRTASDNNATSNVWIIHLQGLAMALALSLLRFTNVVVFVFFLFVFFFLAVWLII